MFSPPPKPPKTSPSAKSYSNSPVPFQTPIWLSDVKEGVEKRLCSDIDLFDDTRDFLNDDAQVALLEEISKGVYGRVYRGIFSSSGSAGTTISKHVAIKLLDVVDDAQEQINLLCELSVLQSLPHERIVKYFGARYVAGGNKMMIILELCKHGALREAIQQYTSMPWNLRVRLCLDTVLALEFLHERKIVHRDVKTTNVVLDDNARAKLCDFAFCVHADSSTRQDFVFGTAEFMAPEVALSSSFSCPADVFSFGICMIEIMTGKTPSATFLLRKPQNGFAIDEDEVSREVLEGCPPAFEALAYLCCSVDPSKRPTAEQLVVELSALLKDLGGPFLGKLGERNENFVSLTTSDKREGNVLYPRTENLSTIRRARANRWTQQSNSSSRKAEESRFGFVELQLQELRAENARMSRDLQSIAMVSSDLTSSSSASSSPQGKGERKVQGQDDAEGKMKAILERLEQLEDLFEKMKVDQELSLQLLREEAKEERDNQRAFNETILRQLQVQQDKHALEQDAQRAFNEKVKLAQEKESQRNLELLQEMSRMERDRSKLLAERLHVLENKDRVKERKTLSAPVHLQFGDATSESDSSSNRNAKPEKEEVLVIDLSGESIASGRQRKNSLLRSPSTQIEPAVSTGSPSLNTNSGNELAKALGSFLDVVSRCNTQAQTLDLVSSADCRLAGSLPHTQAEKGFREEEEAAEAAEEDRDDEINMASKSSPTTTKSVLSRALHKPSPKPKQKPAPNSRNDPAKVYRAFFNNFADQSDSPKRPMLKNFNRDSEDWMKYSGDT